MPNLITYPAQQSLIHAAADFLFCDNSRGLIDLSSSLVLVPTTNAAAKLEDTLSAYVIANHGTGFLPPTIKTPLQIFEDAFPTNVATHFECLQAWINSLRSFEPSQLDRIWPREEMRQKDESFLLTLAVTLQDLNQALGDDALQMDSQELVQSPGEDPMRWQQLAAIYKRYIKHLHQAELEEPKAQMRLIAKNGISHMQWKRILLVGVFDLTRLVIDYLAHLKQVGSQLYALCPEPLANEVTPLAQPIIKDQYLIPISDDSITVTASPTDLGQRIVYLQNKSSASAPSPQSPTLFVCDPELIYPIKRQFENHHMAIYDPSGLPLHCTGLGKLLSDWMQFIESSTLANLSALLEQKPFLTALASQTNTTPTEVLRLVQDARLVHLLPDLKSVCLYEKQRRLEGSDGALPSSSLRELNMILSQWVEQCSPDFGAAGLADWIQQLFAIEPVVSDESTHAVAKLLHEAHTMRLPNVSPAEQWKLVQFELRRTQIYKPHTTETYELRGWLETPFHQSDSCTIAGLHEGCVPQAIPNNPFLSPALRAKYLSRNNESRLARDAFILKLLCLRHPGRSLQIVVSKTGKEDQPVLPSRLLLASSDAELPTRVLNLFKQKPEQTPRTSAKPCCQLRLPEVSPPTTISVTQFKSYLDCPLRFYLRHQLHMEETPLRAQELDALQFGELTHLVLEDFGRNENLRNSTNAADIRRFLLNQLDQRFTDQYGSQPPLLLLLQKEAIATRLEWFTNIQIEECRNGWQIIDAEFLPAQDTPLQIGGLTLKARIDRLDYHPQQNRYRVMDYKTFERTEVSAEKCHLTKAAKGGGGEEEKRRTYQWIDLQLPLYKWIAQHRLGKDAAIETAYFHISPGQSDIRIDTFEIDEPMLASALTCATTIAQAIAHGHFWPPNSTPTYDNFQRIFSGYPPEEILSPETIAFLKGELKGEIDDAASTERCPPADFIGLF